MHTIKLRQLIDLIAGDVESGESRIEKIFEWRFERDLTIIKWVLGLAASLSVAVLIAFFRANSGISNPPTAQFTTIELLVAFAFAAGSATYGIYRFVQLRNLHLEYVAALKLYGRFRAIRDFIHSYRQLP